MRGALLVAMALLVVCDPVAAAAQARFVIPPGREQLVSDLVEEALSAAELDAGWNARIERTVVEVRLEHPEAPGLIATVGHPAAELPRGAGDALAPGVAVACDPPCAASSPRWQRLARSLADARNRRNEALWTVASGPPPPGDPGAEAVRLRWLTHAMLVGLLAWILWVAWEARGGKPNAAQAALWALLVGFVLVALLVPPQLPVHNHLSFVLRADCAVDPLCDRDPAGPAWSPPAFHVYELLLAPWPYSMRSRALVSLGLSALSLLLLFALARRLMERAHLPHAGAVALLAVGFTAFHPVWLRLSVSATFWPLALCLLLGAGLACLRATADHRPPLARLADATAAAVMLSLAALTNLAFLAMLPLLAIAPIAWSRARPRWQALLGLGVAAALLAAHASSLSADLTTSSTTPAHGLLDRPPIEALLLPAVNHLYAHPSITPVTLLLLAVLGILRMARQGLRPWLPVLWAWLVCEWGLAAVAPDLHVGYPTKLIHGQPALPWLGLLAAVGAGGLAAWLGACSGKRRLAWLLVAASPLALLPLADDGLRFMMGRSVIAREARMLADAFRSLPPHDLLVVPPRILEPQEGLRWAEDPVEAGFPAGDYRAAMRRRGLAPAPVIPLDAFLERGAPGDAERVLVYAGSTLHTFDPNELAAGVVPPDFRRPLLRELQDRHRLEPVETFELRTEQDPRIAMRLAADRVPTIEVGFYRLHPPRVSRR